MEKFTKKYTVLFLIVPVLIGTVPLLFYPEVIPVKDDVDYILGLMEALRRTILEYGEFPFWNPWCHGGVPLFANTHTPLFAIEMLCVLIFGTFYGIRAAVFLYGLLAAFSTYLFLGDFTKNPFARFYGACIFSLAGCFSLHIVNGHFVFMGFSFLPLLLWFVRRLGKKEWYYAAGIGTVAGMMLNHNVHYPSLFCLSFAAVYAIPAMLRHYRQMFFWKNVLLAIAVTFALGGYRLLITADFMLDYPRKVDIQVMLPLKNLIIALTEPFQDPWWKAHPKGAYLWEWHEIGCYVGVFALFLAFYSFITKIRWYHWVIVITALLTIDSQSCFLPGYWLREIKAFSSCWVITRWRFIMILFLSAAAAVGFSRIFYRKYISKIKLLILLAISIVMLTANEFWTYRYAVQNKTQTELATLPVKRPPGNQFVTMAFTPSSVYAAVCNNVDNLFAEEPALGFLHKSSFYNVPFGQKEYFGEIFSRNAKLMYRSPNRIEFYAVCPTKIRINANAGNYWRLNDTPLFPQQRSFEEERFFIVELKQPGYHVLSAVPGIHSSALYFSLISALIALLIIFQDVRRKKEKVFESQTEKT